MPIIQMLISMLLGAGAAAGGRRLLGGVAGKAASSLGSALTKTGVPQSLASGLRSVGSQLPARIGGGLAKTRPGQLFGAASATGRFFGETALFGAGFVGSEELLFGGDAGAGPIEHTQTNILDLDAHARSAANTAALTEEDALRAAIRQFVGHDVDVEELLASLQGSSPAAGPLQAPGGVI